MTEPTTEQKIELLVRSVLEAVDARLDTVRHEMAVFAAEADQRHHGVLAAIADLDARLTALAEAPSVQRAELDALAREIAEIRGAAGDHPAPPIAEPSFAPVLVAAPAAGHERAPDVSEPGAVVTGSHPVLPESFEELSRPIVTHITTQVPIVPDLTHHDGHDEHAEHLPLTVPPPVVPHFHDEPSDHDPSDEHPDDLIAELPERSRDASDDGGDGEIDLDQLTSLLTERLGSMSLPVPHDD